MLLPVLCLCLGDGQLEGWCVVVVASDEFNSFNGVGIKVDQDKEMMEWAVMLLDIPAGYSSSDSMEWMGRWSEDNPGGCPVEYLAKKEIYRKQISMGFQYVTCCSA